MSAVSPVGDEIIDYVGLCTRCHDTFFTGASKNKPTAVGNHLYCTECAEIVRSETVEESDEPFIVEKE